MLIGGMTYTKALELKEHLLALRQTTVHLYERDGADDWPWAKFCKVEAQMPLYCRSSARLRDTALPAYGVNASPPM